MSRRFWRDEPDAPYATLLSVIENYVSPESYDPGTLKRRALRTDIPQMQTFKNELREAVADPTVLPDGSLQAAAAYEDGDPRTFLSRLWHELYGDDAGA